MRILIVEDDPQLQDSVANLLREAGYAVDVSSDGTEGLYVGEEYPIDLAVIDLGLPGLSGLDVIRRLRASERDFPILILTARSDWQDKVEGLEAGADDYLTKPFHPEELKARVSALLLTVFGGAGLILATVTVGFYLKYHRLSVQLQDGGDDELLTRLARVQHELEAGDGWRVKIDGNDWPVSTDWKPGMSLVSARVDE